VIIRYEIEFRVRSLGNGGTSLGANTTFVNSNPVTEYLLKGATAQAGSEIPVSLDGDGNFTIPKHITDVNNILLSAFVAETNKSGMTELEKLALNLVAGTILEGVPSWTGIFANTSFEQTANWLLQGGPTGLTGAITAAQFGGTYLFPALKILFTAVPKSVTSLGQLTHGIFHIPAGLSVPDPEGEPAVYQIEAEGPWSGNPTEIFTATGTGLWDPDSPNNVFQLRGGISPNVDETTQTELITLSVISGSTSLLSLWLPNSYTNSALQSGVIYVDYFITCELPGWTGGSTTMGCFRHPYGSLTSTGQTFTLLGPYGGQIFESIGGIVDLATIPVGNWVGFGIGSTKSAAGAMNVDVSVAVSVYPADGVYWNTDEEKQEFIEKLRHKHEKKYKQRMRLLEPGRVLEDFEEEFRSEGFDRDEDASLDRVREVVKSQKGKMTELRTIQSKRS
jgi:hypothetical protein